MQRYARSHLSDQSLLQSAATHAGRERTSTADLLADLAEIDARRLYLPAGYPSLFAYCVGELHLCEHAALKRIQAARAACRFPAIFDAVAEGRLHLSGVVLLAPHLTEHTADELVSAATHKSKSEIERLLAERFPKSDVLAWVEPIPSALPARSGQAAAEPGACQLAPGLVQNGTAPAVVGERSSAKPLSSQSFAVQFTMSRSAHDNLRYAQALLGHQVPAGDIAQVIERSLEVLVSHLEKTGQCTFVSESGHRCEARTPLEFDHVQEFARGGEATVDGIRLRCRAHNQYEAERTFGAEFMRHKRIAAGEARAAAKERAAAAWERAQAAAAEQDPERDVAPWLRQLGFRADEVRRAAERCAAIPDASLEERVKFALSTLARGGIRRGIPAVMSAAAACGSPQDAESENALSATRPRTTGRRRAPRPPAA